MKRAFVLLVRADGWYCATLRGVPGAISHGRTRQSVTRNLERAVRRIAVVICEVVEHRMALFDLRQARAVLRHGKLSSRLRKRLERAIVMAAPRVRDTQRNEAVRASRRDAGRPVTLGRVSRRVGKVAEGIRS
jgi:predicted oxidoreductase (fatty acid repression mutant protein)